VRFAALCIELLQFLSLVVVNCHNVFFLFCSFVVPNTCIVLSLDSKGVANRISPLSTSSQSCHPQRSPWVSTTPNKCQPHLDELRQEQNVVKPFKSPRRKWFFIHTALFFHILICLHTRNNCVALSNAKKGERFLKSFVTELIPFTVL